MKVWIVYLCIAIILISIFGIFSLFYKEKYISSSKKHKSLKYDGHRYNRHHIRSNPHIRRYQDLF